VHGVGGLLGTVLLGVFASKAWNPAGADGLLLGNTGFFLTQVVAVVVSGVWAFGVTYGMLWAINLVTPVRVEVEAEEHLDDVIHGEEAYLQEV